MRWMPGVVHPAPTMKHTIATASSLFDKEKDSTAQFAMKLGCCTRMPGLVGTDALELRNCLQLADHPTVRGGGHENNIAHDGVFLVDRLAIIVDCKIVLRGVVKLDDVSCRGIEDGINFMTLVQIRSAAG